MSETFRADMMEIVKLLRLGYFASAALRLQAVVDQWVAMVNEEAAKEGGAEAVAMTQVLIGDFLKAQERTDYLRMADLLEFQVLPRMLEPDSRVENRNKNN